MKEIVSANKRDIARELARRYSTMTHDELDILESIIVPQKYAKGELHNYLLKWSNHSWN